jgi:hypothetical protein
MVARIAAIARREAVDQSKEITDALSLLEQRKALMA